MSGKNKFPPFFEDAKFGDDEDIFSILEALECVSELSSPMGAGMKEKTCLSGGVDEQEKEDGGQKWKRQKVVSDGNEEGEDGQQKVSHITVERNRRKQMNHNLTVLRSLMPCFYVKRGDQASIIEGVVDYIKEMQQVLKSLEAKKQRKIYSEVLSPRLASSPRPTQLSPRQPPPSPRSISLPISPRTPQSTNPYKPWVHQGYLSPTTMASPLEPSPSPSSSSSLASSINDAVNELVANSKSAMAEVEVKFSGSNVLLKTISPRIPGQAVKLIAAIEEELSLEILNVNITTIDETLLNSFTIKIGIECQLSAEDLAHQIQETFC